MTGAIFWFLEREDQFVRFHAAQATVTFGIIAALIGLFGALAIASLSFLPSVFAVLITAAAVTWVVGVIVWGVSVWKAASGDEFRIPVAAGLAERLLS